MHILVVPLPIQGHLSPMLDLSKLLATSLGCNISFVTAHSALDLAAARCENISNTGIKLVPLEDEDGAVYGLSDSIRFMASKGPDIKQLCLDSGSGFGPVSLNLLDFLLLQPLKQHVLGPVVAFWSSSAAMMHLSMNISKLLEASQHNDGEEINVDIPGIPVKLQARDLPQDPIDPTFKSMLELRSPLLEVSRVLINTFEALEGSSLSALRLEGFKVVPVGPLCGGSEPKLGNSSDESTLKWLTKQAPGSVVFISFGTMLEASGEHIREIAGALEEMGRPFLWTLSNSDPSCAQFLDEFKRKTGDAGLVVRWCPQDRVLRSPSVGVFLTHCGWNSTIQSVACGVPMVGWPQLGDQPVNCKYMTDAWKLGCRLEEATSAGIRKAVEFVMASSETRSRAEQMRSEAAQATLNCKIDLA